MKTCMEREHLAADIAAIRTRLMVIELEVRKGWVSDLPSHMTDIQCELDNMNWLVTKWNDKLATPPTNPEM